MKKIVYIEGMSCHHCEMRVEKSLKSVSDIKKAKANYLDKNCIIEVKKDVPEDIIREMVKQAGYIVSLVEG